MDDKGRVLVSLSLKWRTQPSIAEEYAFLARRPYSIETVTLVILFLYQLHHEGLVEDSHLGEGEAYVWRLSKAGEIEQQRLLSEYPEVALAREDFLLSGCPI